MTTPKGVISAQFSAFMRGAVLQLLVSIPASLAKTDEMNVAPAPVSIRPIHSVVNIDRYYISSPN